MTEIDYGRLDAIETVLGGRAAINDAYGQGKSLVPSGGVTLSSANVYTATQTINSVNSLTLQDGAGKNVLNVSNIAGGGNDAGNIALWGTNGLDVTNGSAPHRAWYIAIDTAAATPYRDLVIGKYRANGGASDTDGIYISNNGTSPSCIGIGVSQPSDTGSPFRLKVQASGSAGDATQGGVQISFATGQTGDMLAIGSSNDATTAFRIRSDGTILAHAAQSADLTVADAVTNATTTVTSATAAFTAIDQGRYVTGTNIPTGSYVTGVTNATTITISQTASGSGSGGALTLLGRAFQFRANSNLPFFTVGSNGGGGLAAAFGVSNVGIGPGVGTAPTATLDVVTTGSTTSNVYVRNTTQGGLRLEMAGSGNVAHIWTSNASGIQIGVNATKKIEITGAGAIGIFGTTAIAQFSTTGQTTGFTAGAGTAVDSAATFTGGTGSTAYTLGDVVRALKLYGWLAA